MDFPCKFLSYNVTDTEKCGEELAKILKAGDFVALFGTLGAGKTAFVRGMAKVLAPSAYAQSPTYTIVNEYCGKIPLFHFDMFRIKNEDDLYSIGFDDYFSRSGIIAAEWCENIPFALPENHYKVTLSASGENSREILLEKIVKDEI